MAQSIPSVACVTGAGFVRGKKRNIEVTRAFEGRKREEAPGKQTLLSTIPFARSPRALYQRNKQKKTKKTGACHEGVPGLLLKSCKWPTVGPNLVPRSHSVLHSLSLGRARSGYEIRWDQQKTSRFIQKPLHPS